MTKKQKRVKDAIAYLKNYFDTYANQCGYLDYTDETVIDDTLYGLGVALYGKECEYRPGYDRFKEKLREHLG